jgi:hypothetical protein
LFEFEAISKALWLGVCTESAEGTSWQKKKGVSGPAIYLNIQALVLIPYGSSGLRV